ncbi:cobalt transporter subunit CbtA (proposed) [Hartmannibacter diazotrophicus]|uniref:Cobalt transporter subunit CbtA (Proposed) n=1 Tax=Hartmannibacter diazotrophicus TaxID=1482074 RepID=A0A2C9DAG7_9HYPH|nr:CbtA family protein [Hartmannibacter diazotrophicus]SON56595.1 cobalt transporter subunit CbtA (proposed) [Hartmannibacter diazotrophicus]
MLTRILWVGLLAGLISGAFVALLQTVTTTPLILKAEVYETAETPAAHDHAAQKATTGDQDATPAHHHDAEAWQPEDGLQRTTVTMIATLATTIGFALMLTAAMVAAGETVTTKTALGWGVAAFFAINLAPALGLSPELPGSLAAALEDRQVWWIATVVATMVGLYLIARVDHWAAKAAGAVLIALPHIVGAPLPPDGETAVPAELAARFVAMSLGLAAIMWLSIGASVGYVWVRLSGGQASEARA